MPELTITTKSHPLSAVIADERALYAFLRATGLSSIKISA